MTVIKQVFPYVYKTSFEEPPIPSKEGVKHSPGKGGGVQLLFRRLVSTQFRCNCNITTVVSSILRK